MRWLAMGLSALTGLWLSQALVDAALGQANPSQDAPSPAFVPGTLMLYYNSQQDRDEAVREMREAKDTVRGGGPGPVQVQEFGDTGISIHIQFPEGTRGGSSSELARLRDIAKRLKQADPRLKHAHPEWIFRVDPPADAGESPQVGLNSFGPSVEPQREPAAIEPNNAFYKAGLQWNYQPPPNGMNAVGAWRTTTGSRDIVVAVVDTGIVSDHVGLDPNNILPGYDFVSMNICTKKIVERSPGGIDPGDDCPADPKPRPPSWHGTHVAGIIGAAHTNNGIGTAGVGWKVSVLPVRVLGPRGGRMTDIIDGMRWAVGLRVKGAPVNNHPADIINMSLGAPIRTSDGLRDCNEDDLPEYIDAIKEVRQTGAVVVVSAGNGELLDANNKPCTSGPEDRSCKSVQEDVRNVSPAGCPGAIAVAASDAQGHLAPYSNYGDVTIMAPGGDLSQKRAFVGLGERALGVWSLVNNGYWKAYEGTSQAAPHVSGAIALALTAHPEWRHRPDGPDQIEKMLKATAAPLPRGACPMDKRCGPGLLDAAAFVRARWDKSPWEANR